MANEVRMIDANALLQSEIERCGRIPSAGSNYFNEERIDRILDKAPTIDPESLRAKGRWVEKDECYACDQCGHLTDYRLSNYCPNCGADMREANNGTP